MDMTEYNTHVRYWFLSKKYFLKVVKYAIT